MDCAPPPPALVTVVRAATALVRQRIGSMPMPRICIDADIPAGAGMATPQTVYFGPTPHLRAPARTWRAPIIALVLHETLHQVTMSRDTGEGIDMAIEEGVCEAVTHDLLPVLIRRIGARPGVAAIAYRDRVGAIRRMSARATNGPWTARAAIAWRAALLATPPAQRTLPA